MRWRRFTRRRQRRRRHKDNKVSLGFKTTFEKREEKETQPYLEDIRPRAGGPGAWGDTADPSESTVHGLFGATVNYLNTRW